MTAAARASCSPSTELLQSRRSDNDMTALDATTLDRLLDDEANALASRLGLGRRECKVVGEGHEAEETPTEETAQCHGVLRDIVSSFPSREQSESYAREIFGCLAEQTTQPPAAHAAYSDATPDARAKCARSTLVASDARTQDVKSAVETCVSAFNDELKSQRRICTDPKLLREMIELFISSRTGAKNKNETHGTEQEQELPAWMKQDLQTVLERVGVLHTLHAQQQQDGRKHRLASRQNHNVVAHTKQRSLLPPLLLPIALPQSKTSAAALNELLRLKQVRCEDGAQYLEWDFHTLHVNEAVRALRENVYRASMLPGRKKIKIITGRGKHANRQFSVLYDAFAKELENMPREAEYSGKVMMHVENELGFFWLYMTEHADTLYATAKKMRREQYCGV